MNLPQDIARALDAAQTALGAPDMNALANALDELGRATIPVDQRLAVAARIEALCATAPSPEAEARLRNLHGQLLTESGDLDSARRTLARCIELAGACSLGDLEWKANTVLGIAEAMAGNLPVAMTHLNLAVEAATRAGNLKAVGRTLINIGNTQNQLGLNAEAAETAQRALDIARDVQDDAAAVSAMVLLGISRLRTGDFNGAQATWLEALGPAQALGATRTVGNLHANLAVSKHRLGFLESARKHFSLASGFFEQAGARHEMAAVLASLGAVMVEDGEFEGALAPLQRAVDAHEQGGDQADAAHARCTLATALTGLARLDEAGAALARAEAQCTADSPMQLRFALVGSQAGLALARKDYARALQSADAHRRLARMKNETGEEAAALCHAAQTHEAAGDLAQAESSAEQAIALLAESGLVPGTRHLEMLALLTRVNLRAGRQADALALVESAIAAAETLPLFRESEGAKVRALASELRRLERAASRP